MKKRGIQENWKADCDMTRKQQMRAAGWTNGKGDDPRPVDKEKFDENFDAIDWRKPARKSKAK